MTVSSSNTRIEYAGNGTTTSFAYNFRILAENNLEVILVSSAGVEDIQSLTTDYTISGVGADAGGSVSMVTAPAVGESLVIRRSMPFTQETDYTSGDPFPAETHEQALDERAMENIQQKEEIGRAVKAPKQDDAIGDLPASGTRADKVMSFDSNGDPETTTAQLIAASDVRALITAYNAGASVATDAENLTFTNAGSGATMRVLEDWLQDRAANVQDYGVLPSNTAAANNAAIEVLLGNGSHDTFWFPDGEYLFEPTIRYTDPMTGESLPGSINMRNNQTLILSPGTILRQADWDGNGGDNDDSAVMISVYSRHNVRIIGNGGLVLGHWDTNGSYPSRTEQSQHGMNIGSSTNCYVDGVVFRGWYFDGYTISYIGNISAIGGGDKILTLYNQIGEFEVGETVTQGGNSGVVVHYSGEAIRITSSDTFTADALLTGGTSGATARITANTQLPANNSKDISIGPGVICDRNGRNGASAVGLVRGLIRGTYTNATRTSPWTGLDLEPNEGATNLRDGNSLVQDINASIVTGGNSFSGASIGLGTATPSLELCTDITLHGSVLPDGLVLTKGSRFTVTGNSISNLKDDPSDSSALNGVLLIECTESVVSGNVIYDCNGNGIKLEQRPAELNAVDNNTIIGNSIYQVGRKTNATYQGITVDGDNNLIMCNKIRNASSGNQPQYGIFLQSTATNNVCLWNDPQGAGTSGGWLDNGTTNKFINLGDTGNKNIHFNQTSEALPSNSSQGLAISDYKLYQAYTGGGGAVTNYFYDGGGQAGQIEVDGAQHTRYYTSGSSVFITSGAGTPESNVTAPVGSLYTRTDGGSSTTLYVKESGTGNTGWVAK